MKDVFLRVVMNLTIFPLPPLSCSTSPSYFRTRVFGGFGIFLGFEKKKKRFLRSVCSYYQLFVGGGEHSEADFIFQLFSWYFFHFLFFLLKKSVINYLFLSHKDVFFFDAPFHCFFIH